MTRTLLPLLLLVLAIALPGVPGPAGSGAALAADSYDWTRPRGSIYSRRRSPNLWSGDQPTRSPLYQRPNRNYGIPNWRQPTGGINPYDKPRKRYGGWGDRH